MNVPKIRFSDSEWNYYTYNELINNKSDSYNPTKTTDNYKCIELEHINQETGTINGFISSLEQKSSKNKFNEGEVLFGKLRPYLKKYWLAKFNGVCSSEIWVLKTINTNLIINKFIYYLVQQHYFLQLCNLSTGSKMPRADWNYIKDQNVAIPTINVQSKISSMLQLLDKKIELQSQKIKALKLYKKGLILSLKKNSFDWHTVCIKDLFKITRGVVIPKNELSEFKSGEYKYPVYSSQTSNQGVLGYSDTFDFNGKYLTWTTDGANAGKVFYRNGKFRCTNVCGVLYEDNIRFTNELFAELLNSETPKHVSYVGNPKLMNNIMANIKIKIPSNDIQENISLVINTINHKVNLENNKLLKLQELKKGLMQSMFV